jgi:hypothetical protein
MTLRFCKGVYYSRIGEQGVFCNYVRQKSGRLNTENDDLRAESRDGKVVEGGCTFQGEKTRIPVQKGL